MSDASPDNEFGFELRTCEWAERNWHPVEGDRPAVIARQLGTRDRRWDTVVVEVDPDGLAARRAFGRRHLDSDLLHVVRNAPAEWAWYRDALPEPDYPWRHVREAVHRAADRDLVETRRDGNRVLLHRKRPYPEWVRRIVAVENKPDLDASAARVLADQLQRDVAVGLADEVWLATERTGERVEPALLSDLPPAVGILVVEYPDADVEWLPTSLSVDRPGTRILNRPDDDRSAARFEYVDPDWKHEKRLELAERAYERGWRRYAEAMRPDCRHFRLRREGRLLAPWCAAKERAQTGRECAGSCPDFEPEPPAWRQREWPLAGGPGRAIERLLRRRRERRRP
ncbi:MAG: DUF5787 family protein [Halobacteriales archaeon]